jgi:hypothetical protein
LGATVLDSSDQVQEVVPVNLAKNDVVYLQAGGIAGSTVQKLSECDATPH